MPAIIAVDQFIQIISSFGMVFVDVRHFRVGFAVDQMIEQVDHRNADGDGRDDHADPDSRFDGFGDQIKADDAEHYSAGKAQKQTDCAAGILLEQSADGSSETGSQNACDGGGQNQCADNSHR